MNKAKWVWSRQNVGWIGKSAKHVAFIWCGCNGKEWWWQVYHRIDGKDAHLDYFDAPLLAGDSNAVNWQQARSLSEKAVLS